MCHHLSWNLCTLYHELTALQLLSFNLTSPHGTILPPYVRKKKPKKGPRPSLYENSLACTINHSLFRYLHHSLSEYLHHSLSQYLHHSLSEYLHRSLSVPYVVSLLRPKRFISGVRVFPLMIISYPYDWNHDSCVYIV